MNLFTKLNRKRRGVSPIIATILLIGLAVLAGAAIYLVVMPMLNPTTGAPAAAMSSTVDTNTTPGYAVFTVTFSNKGLKDVTVTITNVALAGWTQPTPAVITVSSGGSDVTTSGFSVLSGQTISVIITVSGSGSVASGAAITINAQIGAPVNAAQTYSLVNQIT